MWEPVSFWNPGIFFWNSWVGSEFGSHSGPLKRVLKNSRPTTDCGSDIHGDYLNFYKGEDDFDGGDYEEDDAEDDFNSDIYDDDAVNDQNM